MKTNNKPRVVSSKSVQRIAARQNVTEYEKTVHRMKLAVRIYDAMKEQGISKKELAVRLGKYPSEISKWLSGTHNFTFDTLIT